MPTIKINVEKCKGCNFCVDACPLKLIKISNKLNKKGFNYVLMDSDKCTGCGLCFQMCPDLAIEVYK
ncbi:4Fe-4S binding protein [Candidatus Woesearchaeota archaeon]|nr:4Fe-4S binding protein [Candidatus Woesearchaeota archaeon]